MDSWFVVGISGVTNGGKSTLTKKLLNFLPSSTKLICQDDYYHLIDSPLHVPLPEIPNHFNWDIISSIDMEKLNTDVSKILSEPPKLDTINSVQYNNLHPILLLDGFLLFEDPYIKSICNRKFFFTLDFASCLERRKLRTYDPPDVPGYFEKCAWPRYEEHLKKIKDGVPDVVYLDGTSDMDVIFNKVYNELKYVKK